MLSLLLTASLSSVCCGAVGDPPAKNAPAKLELFAKEDWYRGQEGKEQDFVGVLRQIKRAKGVVGFGRFNPYRLEMAGNKIREVYVGGKPALLAPYAGKKVKLTGKAVDMEVEGRQHHEIWPARLAVLAADGAKGEKSGTLKVHAKTPQRTRANSGVIRSAKELAEGSGTTPEEATARLAKAFKLPTIDWDRHMVVTISGGVQRTGGYSVALEGLDVKDKALVVRWKLNRPAPGRPVTQAFTRPSLTILVDRFDGAVRFDPPPPANKRPGLDRSR